MTDSLGVAPRAADVAGLSHLGRVAALVGCFAHDSVATLAGVDLSHSLEFLSDELLPLPWGRDTLNVDGQPVAVATLAHRGLEFAAGDDFLAYPFVLVRLQGGSTPWPALRTVPTPEHTR